MSMKSIEGHLKQVAFSFVTRILTQCEQLEVIINYQQSLEG
jgi:hypothetical protein